MAKSKSSWRDVLLIHPAAELFPLMSPDERKALGEDIIKNGLTSPIVLWRPDFESAPYLPDGRNRLDAIEIATGRPAIATLDDLGWDKFTFATTSDPRAFVISANILRRHLKPEKKRELIAELLKADPSKSDRQIAETIKASPTTVGTVRAEMEAKGDVSKLDTRQDTKGRAQPARRSPNHTRARLYREAKLGGDTVTKIKGTSLDNANEMDELVILNRGAPEGEHTEAVKQLIDAAVAGQSVSAADYTKDGRALRREDIGPASAGECERKDSEIRELRNAKRMLEIKIGGLESENEELKARPAPTIDAVDDDAAQLGALLRAWDKASAIARERFLTRTGLQWAVPPGETPDIPPFLRRLS